MKVLLYVFGLAIAAGALPISIAAHKVNLFAYTQADRVFCECYSSDGKPVQGGKIMVFDSSNHLILEGVSDQLGRFFFDLPADGDLIIVLEASMGHKATFKLKRT